LHHYLLKAGVSHAGALGVLTLSAVVISALGLMMSRSDISGFASLVIFFICCAALVLLVVTAGRWARSLPRSFKTAEIVVSEK
jgi:hypothetical protein